MRQKKYQEMKGQFKKKKADEIGKDKKIEIVKSDGQSCQQYLGKVKSFFFCLIV